jgi:hypothetical protein
MRRARISNMHQGCNSSRFQWSRRGTKNMCSLHRIFTWYHFDYSSAVWCCRLPVNFISLPQPFFSLWEESARETYYTSGCEFVCVCRGAISSFETPNAQSILQFVHQVVINKLNTLCGRRGRGGSNPPGCPQVIIIMKSPVLCCMKIMSRATKALHSIIELLIIMNNNTDTHTSPSQQHTAALRI